MPCARRVCHAHVHARQQCSEAELRTDRQADCGQNDQRLLAGIQSVAPALATLNLVAGTYGRNVAIATGEWAAAIDRKLAELRRAKKTC
jgi:hypothetical protein